MRPRLVTLLVAVLLVAVSVTAAQPPQGKGKAKAPPEPYTPHADSQPQSVIDRLKPLTEGGNPWRPTALELTAAAKLKAGDKPGALDIYKKLADDLAAPEGMRARTAEMAAVLAS